MDDDYLNVVMGIIINGGNAKGLAYEAIQKAKAGDFDAAEKLLEASKEAVQEAHATQTDLLTRTAQGEDIEVNLYMVHAKDHLMNAMTFQDVAKEFVDQERRIHALEAAVQSHPADTE